MNGRPLYSVGDPGRAALELPPGPPAGRIGQADAELSSASLPGMLIVAASCRGLEHRATCTPRQDAFALSRRRAYGVSEAVAVVCDGVGGFGRSDEAATLASRRLAGLRAEGVPWPEAFELVNKELRKIVDDLMTADPGGEGMATTAVALSVRRHADEWIGEVASVGDSALWHLSADGQWSALAGPQDAEASSDAVYHSSDVVPLPSPDGACERRDVRVEGGALFLMCDGVANPLRWSRDVRDALAEWWARPPDPFVFGAQVAFARKSHVDDRTVVGIWPDEGP